MWGEGRSQWPRGLRRTSTTARVLGIVGSNHTVGIDVCRECCVLSGRGLCDALTTRPEESYRMWCVVVCDLETSRMRRPWPALGRSATGKTRLVVVVGIFHSLLFYLCISVLYLMMVMWKHDTCFREINKWAYWVRVLFLDLNLCWIYRKATWLFKGQGRKRCVRNWDKILAFPWKKNKLLTLGVNWNYNAFMERQL